MKTTLKTILMVAVGMFATSHATAEDIDLFVGLPPTQGDLPNVLIIVDNTSNWNTAFANEKGALVAALNGLPADKFRVGLMLFSESGGSNGTPGGAYVRAAIRTLDGDTKDKYANLVSSLSNDPPDTDKGSGRTLGLSMAEAYRYFSGGAAYAGHNKVKRDYPNNVITPVSAYAHSNVVYALTGNAFASSGSGTYVSPVLPASCAKNFIIYIGNSTSGNVVKDNSSDNDAAAGMLSSAGGNTSQIPISPTAFQDNIADEWARFMKTSALAITTYTLDVDRQTTGNGPSNTALLNSMAAVSSGKYFDVSSGEGGQQIVDALNTILSEIASVNSVFASVSLPVSVNTQGTYLNQVFVGMFRPDANALPRWAGNLKQYKLGFVGKTLRLLDADDTSAINSQRGFITECARSYWTPSTTDNYWYFAPEGKCLTVADSDVSNYPDGNIVEKGAAAYKLRSSTARTVKTCAPGACTSMTNFDTANASISETLLGIGPRNISSVSSPSAVTATSVEATLGDPSSIQILSTVDSGSKRTATASETDVAKIGAANATGQLEFANGDICTVTVKTGTTFQYNKNNCGSVGAQIVSLPSTQVVVTKPSHGLNAIEKVTMLNCTNLTGLNGKIGIITSTTTDSFTASFPAIATGGTGANCQYASHKATVVTTVPHLFLHGDQVTIAGVSQSGYNGTFTIHIPEGADEYTFQYQHNVAAPLGGGGGGTASDTLANRTDIINWARGLDVGNENLNNLTTTEMRPSAHGDVVHSRPVAINFGTDDSPQVVVFYGDNHGALHAINGNRTGDIGSTAAGRELWAFIPPEFYSSLKRVYKNAPAISFLGGTGVRAPKPYGMDGSVVGHKEGDSTWIFSTMRRGGRALYAFDVGSPASPSLKWRVGCLSNFPTIDSDGSDCSAGFTGMGQSWSSPKLLKTNGYTTGGDAPAPKPMLIVGGGYDTCEDYDAKTSGGANHQCTSSTKGNHIYLIDADTGALLQTFNTERAVVGDIFVIPGENGTAKYAYAADLGGNIYRLSGADANSQFADTAPSNTVGSGWTMTKIAALGCDTPTDCTANRKFMFGPDVVEQGGVYYLVLGSGDREKPLTGFAAATAVTNYFFVVKDSPATATWLSSESINCGGTDVICLASLMQITSSTPSQDVLAEKKGWYLKLDDTEQVVTSAITVFGTVIFSTHQPAVPNPNPDPTLDANNDGTPDMCESNLGKTFVYNVLFSNASGVNADGSRSERVSGDGLPPSPVAGMVTLDNGETVPFVIGADGDSPLEGGIPTTPSPFYQPKSRTYWYIQQ